SAIAGNQQAIACGVALASHQLAPAANRVYGEFGSVVVDADADPPDIRADVIDSIRSDFAEFLVDEIMNLDLVGTTLRTVVAARVLVRADGFLFLRVDRDHGLTGGLKGFDLRVDEFELSVPVGMLAAFQALAVDLTTVAERFEQLRNPARRNPMPHLSQRERELLMALGHPQQRSHRVAQRRRLQQAAQVLQQRRIGSHERWASPSWTPNLRTRGIDRLQIRQATIDRAARNPRRPSTRAAPAISGRTRLRRTEQPPAPLVQARPHRLEAAPNQYSLNHDPVIDNPIEPGNPPAAATRERNPQRPRSRLAPPAQFRTQSIR